MNMLHTFKNMTCNLSNFSAHTNWFQEKCSLLCNKLLSLNNRGSDIRVTKYSNAGSGPIWLTNVGCRGSEDHIDRCSHSGWGNVGTCTHADDVGVNCGRLTGSK